MSVSAENTRSYEETPAGMGWQAPRPMAGDKQAAILAQVEEDMKFVGVAPDTYSFGTLLLPVLLLSLLLLQLL